MKYKVIKKFSDANIGDIVDLNERRAKSELANGNVKEYKQERKTKELKRKKQTK